MPNGDEQMKYDAPKGFPFLVIDSQTNSVAACYTDQEEASKQAANLNAGFPGRYEVIYQD